jgi:hypothetical protein
MALVTHATVTIEAVPSEVFAWLIDPAKLTTWLGAPGGMPENASELHAGWTGSSTMAAPVGGTDLTVDADTDFAAADTSGVDAVLKGQRAPRRWFVNAWLFVMKLVLAHRAFDHGIAAAMSASQDESLMKLKKVVEAT